jgi:hypothetical protein
MAACETIEGIDKREGASTSANIHESISAKAFFISTSTGSFQRPGYHS